MRYTLILPIDIYNQVIQYKKDLENDVKKPGEQLTKELEKHFSHLKYLKYCIKNVSTANFIYYLFNINPPRHIAEHAQKDSLLLNIAIRTHDGQHFYLKGDRLVSMGNQITERLKKPVTPAPSAQALATMRREIEVTAKEKPVEITPLHRTKALLRK